MDPLAGLVSIALLGVILAIPVLILVLWRRRVKRRRAHDAPGTYRSPLFYTLFGWVVAALGAFFLLFGGIAALEGEPEVGMTITGGAMLVIGVIWAFVYGRRWITVWGEKVRYQPFFAARRTIWAQDAVDVREEEDARKVVLFIRGREGLSASWHSYVFPPRTVAAFRHGAHRNALETGRRGSPVLGMDPFSVQTVYEREDGSADSWHGDRTVQLEILVSSPDPAILRRALDQLASNGDSPDRTIVQDAHIQWQRRPDATALDAHMQATGENGLQQIRDAYGWFRDQLVASVMERGDGGTGRRRARARPQEAFVLTYRETWT